MGSVDYILVHVYIQKMLLRIKMNFQKNVPFPHEKEQGKEHFQLQTFFSIGKEHKNCSVKPPQPAFRGMKNSALSICRRSPKH